MRAVMKYPGSKWGLARWIISFFPPHHSYLEPYFGSGAVLFRKHRSNIETVNDLDSDVVGLFDCIRRDPERLARAVYFTPYSREMYERTYQEMPDDPFEKALYFCIRLDQGHGFRTCGGKVGWKNDVQGRERAYAARDRHEMTDKDHEELLKGWHRETRKSHAQNSAEKEEVLWMNFEPVGQMRLFDQS